MANSVSAATRSQSLHGGHGGEDHVHRDLELAVSGVRAEVRVLKWACALALVALLAGMGVLYQGQTDIRWAIGDIQNSLGRLHVRVDHLDKSVAGLNRTAAAHSESIAELNRTVAVHSESIADLNRTVAVQGESIVELNRTMTARGESMAELSRTVSARGESMATQSDRLGRIEELLQVLVARSQAGT